MTNSSIFFNTYKDMKAMQQCKLQLPENVLILNQNFGEFNPP